jgi:nucleotidyltransferase/DNA polymerase involved in DNA repair
MEGIAEEEELPEVGAAAGTIDYSELIPLEDLEMLTDRLRERLEGHGIHTVQDVLARDRDELSTIPGIGPVTAQKLLDMARKALDDALAEAAADARAGEE